MNIRQYSTNKSKSLLGSGRHIRDQQVVAELDSAMNKWIDTVPEHCMHSIHILISLLLLNSPLVIP